MADKNRTEEFMKADFLSTSGDVESEYRVATALEYIANHVGKIDAKLGEIVSILKKQQEVAD